MGHAPCKAGHELSVRYYMIRSKSHVRWVGSFWGTTVLLVKLAIPGLRPVLIHMYVTGYSLTYGVLYPL